MSPENVCQRERELERAAVQVVDDWKTTFRANPVTVRAYEIQVVHPTRDGSIADGVYCHLSDGRVVLAGRGMIARYIPEPGDYWVVQEDAYEYINPRAVFERKYKPAYVNLTFGDAIDLLKRGAKVARRGWNRKDIWPSDGCDMWLSYSPGSPGLDASKFWSPHNRDFAVANGGKADVLPCITMKTATGEILMGWLASQTDMLASDWLVVP